MVVQENSVYFLYESNSGLGVKKLYKMNRTNLGNIYLLANIFLCLIMSLSASKQTTWNQYCTFSLVSTTINFMYLCFGAYFSRLVFYLIQHEIMRLKPRGMFCTKNKIRNLTFGIYFSLFVEKSVSVVVFKTPSYHEAGLNRSCSCQERKRSSHSSGWRSFAFFSDKTLAYIIH